MADSYNTKFVPSLTWQKEVLSTDIIARVKEAAKKGEAIFKVKVTALEADDLMTLNVDNRHVNKETVGRYAQAMLDGKWMYNSSSNIGISTQFRLTNAQHRLMAQVKSGCTVEYNIITGLDPKSFATEDVGRNRTGGDVYSVRHIDNPNKAAAVANFVLAYTHFKKVPGLLMGRQISQQLLDEWADIPTNLTRLAEAMNHTTKVLSKEGKDLLPYVYWAGLYFLLTTRHNAQGTEFLTRLALGTDMSPKTDSTLYQLLIALRKFKDKGPKQSKGLGHQKVLLVLTAWNMIRSGQEMKGERFKADPSLPELPKIM